MNRLFFYKQILSNLDKGNLSDILNFKYYQTWKKFVDPDLNSISERLPWINFPAIDFLKDNIKSHFKVFEYGGGGSTLFFLDRVKEVVTVEHNKEWFEILTSKIIESDRNRWQGNFIEAEKNNSEEFTDASNPSHYASADPSYKGMHFRSYASCIDKFQDEYFDVVLIDGRARPSCILHSIKKVKSGGLLILDNAEREYYLEKSNILLGDFDLLLNKFAPLPFVRHFTQTNIWKRN